jgi:hypothetical protein
MKRALVVGCGPDVWNDVKQAQKLVDFDAVYCVKLAAVHWPGRFDVFVTLHPEWIEDYKKQRAALGRDMNFETVAPLAEELGRHAAYKPDRRVSYLSPGVNLPASSGIYAAKVALEDGFERVVLAGVPMQKTNHFARGTPWLQVDCFLPGFERALPYLHGKVKSMSGRTKDALGFPDVDWLTGSGD